MTTPQKPILVLTGTGKAGRHTVAHLRHRGYEVRVGSRKAAIPFHWDDPASWEKSLQGVDTVFAAIPDFHVPIRNFIELAESSGVHRIVGLAGRGGREMVGAPFNEVTTSLEDSTVDWTLLEPTNFNENFSEGVHLEEVLNGQISLPMGDTTDPYIAVDDVGAVAAEVLTQPGHAGKVYELTGPQALTFDQVCQILSQQIGSTVRFVDLDPSDFAVSVKADPQLQDIADFMIQMYEILRSGTYSEPTDNVEKILGREPLEFSEWARRAFTTGAWS